MKNRNNLIDINEMSEDEIVKIIDVATKFKKAMKLNAVPRLLEGYNLAMIFELPSTRTRVSFETAMNLLGGNALYLKPGEIHLGSRETVEDTAKVLSRFCDGILVRSFEHSTVLGFAEYADVPVINGLTNYNHPTQAIADIMTILEDFEDDLDNLNICFIGDRTNVCNSLFNISVKLNIGFTQIAPKNYQILPSIIKEALKSNPNYKKEIIISDTLKHIKNKDIIYTDLWWWVDQENEQRSRQNAFITKYQVDMKKILKTKNPNVKFMHCMPINHEMEVTREVLESKYSVVLNQSENRLYIEMAILVIYLSESRIKSTVEEKLSMKNEIIEELNKVAIKSL